MTTLAQIVAIEKGVKAKTDRAVTTAYHTIQKTEPLSGIAREYQPKDEDGDKLPSESTLVQTRVEQIIDDFAAAQTRLVDVTLTKETANCLATADVVIDGNVLVKDAPVTFLLFLEKRLVDAQTFISKLPTLDPGSEWVYDSNAGVYAATPFGTTRTKKVPRNHVKAEATDKHPAQVEIFYEDIIVGTWTTRKFSGAIPMDRKTELLERVDKLIQAVKFAREEANSRTVTDVEAGDAIFSFLFSR